MLNLKPIPTFPICKSHNVLCSFREGVFVSECKMDMEYYFIKTEIINLLYDKFYFFDAITKFIRR